MQSYVDTTAPDALSGIWVQKLNNKNLLFLGIFTSHIH